MWKGGEENEKPQLSNAVNQTKEKDCCSGAGVKKKEKSN